MDNRDWFYVALLMLFIALVIAAIFSFMASEGERWENFKAAHSCKVVAKIDGSTAIGVGPAIGGKGGVVMTTTSIPGKTGWLCDDGITYFK